MSIRLLYARKRCLVQFCVNKQRIGDLVYLKHLKGTDLYPCLSMDSKGAAVQILEDEFWYSDKDGTVSLKEINFAFQSHY